MCFRTRTRTIRLKKIYIYTLQAYPPIVSEIVGLPQYIQYFLYIMYPLHILYGQNTVHFWHNYCYAMQERGCVSN
jgi:hypothetical protein